MKTYKFKLYPNKENKILLFNTLNSCRKLYNKLLETWLFYNEQDINLSGFDLTKYLTSLKKEEDYQYLNNINSKVLQMTAIKLGKNIKSAFAICKRTKRLFTPRFKSKFRYSSFVFNQSGYKIIDTNKRFNILKLSKIGDIKFRQSQEIIGNIKQIQIKLKPSGWYCYITTDVDCQYKRINDKEIGIDMGILKFLTTSNNEVIENPLYLKQKLLKIKLLSKRLSRTKKNSNNRRKVINKILRLYETIDNQKQDFFHKLTTKLVENNKLLVLEDLNIKSMTNKKKNKNKYHNMRNILDSSWYKFINMLKTKVSSTDSKIIFVNPRNTSKMCSKCGNIKTNLQLSDRIYNCDNCNLSIDRDYNASINILRKGKELTFVGVETMVSAMNQESISFRM